MMQRQFHDEIRRLIAVVTNARELMFGISSLNDSIRDRLKDKLGASPQIPQHPKVVELPIPPQDSPPTSLRARLSSLSEAYEESKEVLGRLLEHNRKLAIQDELESRASRRDMLLHEVSSLKAEGAMEYLMLHPEICSVSELPDHLVPDSLRGNPRRTQSISNGYYDSWRER